MTFQIIEGTTEFQRFQLFENGSPLDLSGLTVAGLLEDRYGTATSLTGLISVVDALNGLIDIYPTAGMFQSAYSPYYLRWQLTDANGLVGYDPTALRDTIVVLSL